jgi:hypothetical protein
VAIVVIIAVMTAMAVVVAIMIVVTVVVLERPAVEKIVDNGRPRTGIDIRRERVIEFSSVQIVRRHAFAPYVMPHSSDTTSPSSVSIGSK